jgi:hypothetical protein
MGSLRRVRGDVRGHRCNLLIRRFPNRDHGAIETDLRGLSLLHGGDQRSQFGLLIVVELGDLGGINDKSICPSEL